MITWRPSRLFVLVCTGVFVASLDQTSVVTVLSPLLLDLGVPVTELDRGAWVVTAYLLGFTVAMPLLGRAGDLYGHHHLYLVALVVFAAASALVASAERLDWLIAARVVQAAGGGALVPAAIALVTHQVAPRRRALVIGVIAATAEAGAVFGPLVGGLIADAWSWRWVFWINLPLCALLIAGLLRVPAPRPSPATLDTKGGLLLTAGLLLLTLGLSQRSLFSWFSPTPYALVAAAVVCIATLAYVENRIKMPLLAPALFRHRGFQSAFAAQLLVGGALVLALATIPLMADVAQGKSPLEGGLRLMRLTGAIPVGAVAGGNLSRPFGDRTVAIAGLALMSAGFIFMARWTLDAHDPMMSLHLATAGIGFGLVIAPLTTSAVNAAPQGYLGAAAALVTVARMLGMTLGLAAVAAWGVDQFQASIAGLVFPLPGVAETAADQQRRFTEYQAGITNASVLLFQRFFIAGAILSTAAILPALWLPGRQHRARDLGDTAG